MGLIEKAERAELDFYDFDSLLAALDAGDLTSDDALVSLDDHESERELRVRDYVGRPGSDDAVCPHCGLGGGIVDSEGFFTCARCDYYNWEATPNSDRVGPILVCESEAEDAEHSDTSAHQPSDLAAIDIDRYFDVAESDDALDDDFGELADAA